MKRGHSLFLRVASTPAGPRTLILISAIYHSVQGSIYSDVEREREGGGVENMH